jgi:hypothetical protein
MAHFVRPAYQVTSNRWPDPAEAASEGLRQLGWMAKAMVLGAGKCMVKA